jgi:CheY-like chemotaxis protein
VTLRLPLAPGVFLADPAGQGSPDAPSGLRMLLIDDDAVLRRVLADILIEDGHSVVEAAGGRDALMHLERGDRFDVVITDLGMPEMNGWDVARAVKARWPKLRVVLVTGWGQDAEGSDEERGAVDVTLAKPVTIESLRTAMQAIRGQ